MNLEFTLKNYRCFSDQNPARFCIREGFIAFIGVNNAGKSTLLKFFYEFRHLFNYLTHPNELSAALNGNGNPIEFRSVKDKSAVFYNQNTRDLEIEIRFLDKWFDSTANEVLIPNKLEIKVRRHDNNWSLVVFAIDQNNTEINTIGKTVMLKEGVITGNGIPFINLDPCSLAIYELTKTLYIGPFRNAINVRDESSYYDIQVGQAFIQSWHNAKTGLSITSNETVHQVTEDIKRIFEFDKLEINAAESYYDFKVFINGKSYTLVELGGGLAQFIITLGTAALRQPSFILIDEPELNLHPKLQLDFLTALGSYAKYGVLFASHNIGLARASAELIYSIRVNKNGDHIVTALEKSLKNTSLSEFLGELSFSGYRELGFTKLLLVEGTHDVTTFQQLLRKYGKDHEVVILPLGGASLINETSELQLQEVKRITEDVYAIIDSERNGEDAPLAEDRRKFVEICKTVDIPCHILERRATENYFSERAIQIVKSEKYHALQPYEALDKQNGWGKAENWRIAREMVKSELDNTDLGQFLEEL